MNAYEKDLEDIVFIIYCISVISYLVILFFLFYYYIDYKLLIIPLVIDVLKNDLKYSIIASIFYIPFTMVYSLLLRMQNIFLLYRYIYPYSKSDVNQMYINKHVSLAFLKQVIIPRSQYKSHTKMVFSFIEIDDHLNVRLPLDRYVDEIKDISF